MHYYYYYNIYQSFAFKKPVPGGKLFGRCLNLTHTIRITTESKITSMNII